MDRMPINQRDIAPTVLAALKEMPVGVKTGMRQTGKTTFLQRQPGLDQRRQVTFDDFPQLPAAKLWAIPLSLILS